MARWILIAIFGLFAFSSQATEWSLKKYPKEFPHSKLDPAPDGLPDGGIVHSDGTGSIAAAWYSLPTERYTHGILGDAIEAGALTIGTSDGNLQTYELPDHLVFEDRTPRLVDLDGFGDSKIVTILSSLKDGAAIAVFGLVDDRLELITQTPFIGHRNRWRNIAGIADFDGDGSLQIAEVVTPHIGGTLNFWTWKNDTLTKSASMYGFSNHAIGSREQDLSVADDFDGDGVTDLALPDVSRQVLKVMKFIGAANGEKTLVDLAEIPTPKRIEAASGLISDDNNASVVLKLQNRSVWVAKP